MIESILEQQAVEAAPLNPCIGTPSHRAWREVTKVLDQIDPDWNFNMMHSPAENAVSAIKKLAYIAKGAGK